MKTINATLREVQLYLLVYHVLEHLRLDQLLLLQLDAVSQLLVLLSQHAHSDRLIVDGHATCPQRFHGLAEHLANAYNTG